MSNQVDLRQLAVRREEDHPLPVRRHLLSRYVLPAMILSAVLVLVTWAAWDALLPAREVTVIPVSVRQAAVQQAGEPLFSAAGWVEPRPTPVLVPAMAEGVVRELLVVEDQAVAAGEPVAQLVDTDAKLSLERAEAELQARQSERDGARARLAAAQANLERPLHLQASLAEAESLLAQTETAVSAIPFEIRTAEAHLRLAQQTLARKTKAGEAVPVGDREKAQNEVEHAEADLQRLRARQPRLEVERQALLHRHSALAEQLQRKTEETRQLAEAQAAQRSAEAQVAQARVVVQECRLRLERMTVRSPIAGRVLDLVAQPGSHVVGASSAEGSNSTVVTLYNPQALQVRADVRLEDVRNVTPGQHASITTAAVDGPLEGKVLFVTSSVNIQKNTLEVKVELTNPPPMLKPAMLAQVTFLASESPLSSPPGEKRLRVYVPNELVQRQGGSTMLWIADQAAGVARRQAVRLGRGVGNDLIEVPEGLTPASRLIVAGRDGLRDGQRIRVSGEDARLGSQTASK